ncbi:MAG: flippase-like domain-containing protein [Lewinellaceae bacterium]|nr:flippase-like domain-containing protein [Lewinellaceae bacterium]
MNNYQWAILYAGLPIVFLPTVHPFPKHSLPWLSHTRLNLVLKLALLALLVSLLYFDLTSRGELPAIFADFMQRLKGRQQPWLWLALALMPLNWLAETRKWQLLVRKFEDMATPKAFIAVLAGVSISLFTPNRIGEYAGRMLFVRQEHQWKAVIANLVGNYAQLIVLLGAGLLGAGCYLQQFFPVRPDLFPFLLLPVVLACLGLLLGYFNIDLIIPLARRIPGIRYVKRFVKDVGVLRQFSRKDLAQTLGWSVGRYLIYSLQYYALLQYFGIQIGLFEALGGISTLFLLQTSIPLPPVTGVVVRGNLAVHVWAIYGANEISSLATTFALLIINLILPSLIGMIALLRINIAHSLGYEDDKAN